MSTVLNLDNITAVDRIDHHSNNKSFSPIFVPIGENKYRSFIYYNIPTQTISLPTLAFCPNGSQFLWYERKQDLHPSLPDPRLSNEEKAALVYIKTGVYVPVQLPTQNLERSEELDTGMAYIPTTGEELADLIDRTTGIPDRTSLHADQAFSICTWGLISFDLQLQNIVLSALTKRGLVTIYPEEQIIAHLNIPFVPVNATREDLSINAYSLNMLSIMLLSKGFNAENQFSEFIVARTGAITGALNLEDANPAFLPKTGFVGLKKFWGVVPELGPLVVRRLLQMNTAVLEPGVKQIVSNSLMILKNHGLTVILTLRETLKSIVYSRLFSIPEVRTDILTKWPNVLQAYEDKVADLGSDYPYMALLDPDYFTAHLSSAHYGNLAAVGSALFAASIGSSNFTPNFKSCNQLIKSKILHIVKDIAKMTSDVKAYEPDAYTVQQLTGVGIVFNLDEYRAAIADTREIQEAPITRRNASWFM